MALRVATTKAARRTHQKPVKKRTPSNVEVQSQLALIPFKSTASTKIDPQTVTVQTQPRPTTANSTTPPEASTLPSSVNSDSQKLLQLAPFENPVTIQTQPTQNQNTTTHVNPTIQHSIPKITSLMPAMTISTIGKVCVPGIALIGTAVVLALSIKAGLIVAPVAGAVVLFCALQSKLSAALNLGKQGASMVAAGASQVMTPQVVVTATTVASTVASPLAIVAQGAGVYQELTAQEGDTETQQLALQKQRVSAGISATSLINQTLLAGSPKMQLASWAVMGAMTLATSSAAKTNIPLLEKTREKVAAVSNTAIEAASAASLGYQVAQSTNSPAAGLAVATVGIAAATVSNTLVKFDNKAAQKLQIGTRKVTDLMVKVGNSISIGSYIGKFSPTLGTVVSVACCIFSLCAFAKTQGIASGMKNLFSRVTASVQQKKPDEAAIKQEEKVAEQKKRKEQTKQMMNQATAVLGVAQIVGRQSQKFQGSKKADLMELAKQYHGPKPQKTTTKSNSSTQFDE